MVPLQRDILKLGIAIDNINILFGNIKEVYELNTEMLMSLEKLCTTRPDRQHISIGESLINYSNKLKITYSKYTVNCQLSLDTLIKLTTKEKSFRNWIRKINEDTQVNRLQLQDYLVNPIKRMVLYPLMIKQLVKYTPSSDVEYPTLLNALQYVSIIYLLFYYFFICLNFIPFYLEKEK